MTLMKLDRSIAPDGFLKPLAKIIGGKQGNSKISGRSLMYKAFPKDFDKYVELFCGSGAVFIGNSPGKEEVVNDIDPYVINFYTQVKHNPDELWKELELNIEKIKSLPETPEYFYNVLRPAQCEPKGIEGAVWFYLINRLANNGIFRFNKNGVCNSSWCKTYKNRGYHTKEHFYKVSDRIKSTKFYNLHYEDLLRKIECNSRTLIVADPPYDSVFTSYNRRKFTGQDHFILSEHLRLTKANWLLTINDTEYIRTLYKDFNLQEVVLHYQCSNTPAGRGKAKELIITNY